jgi:hypothetical protein
MFSAIFVSSVLISATEFAADLALFGNEYLPSEGDGGPAVYSPSEEDTILLNQADMPSLQHPPSSSDTFDFQELSLNTEMMLFNEPVSVADETTSFLDRNLWSEDPEANSIAELPSNAETVTWNEPVSNLDETTSHFDLDLDYDDPEADLMKDVESNLWNDSLNLADCSSSKDLLTVENLSRFRRRVNHPAVCIYPPPGERPSTEPRPTEPPSSWWPFEWPGDALRRLQEAQDNDLCSELSRGLFPVGVCPTRGRDVEREEPDREAYRVENPIPGTLHPRLELFQSQSG